jgi:hypothetical protein
MLRNGTDLDSLDDAALSELVANTKNSLDELTSKADINGLSLLEQAQKHKNTALLNEYYQRAVSYYKNSRSGVMVSRIDAPFYFGQSPRFKMPMSLKNSLKKAATLKKPITMIITKHYPPFQFH